MDVLPVLLTNNPYRDLINPIEILDERAFDRVARELLFDQDVLQTQAELRESYLGELEACPGPVERLRDFLS